MAETIIGGFKIGDKVRYQPWIANAWETWRGEWVYGNVRGFDQYGNVWVVSYTSGVGAVYVDPKDCEHLS
jgi:hypothetical protein